MSFDFLGILLVLSVQRWEDTYNDGRVQRGDEGERPQSSLVMRWTTDEEAEAGRRAGELGEIANGRVSLRFRLTISHTKSALLISFFSPAGEEGEESTVEGVSRGDRSVDMVR